jgi:hypothetical protein
MTTTTFPGLGEDNKMILPIWITLIALALILSLVSLYKDAILLQAVAGVNWIIVAITSSDVNYVIVYQNTDYLKPFSYAYLIMFFGILGVCFLLYSAWRGYKLVSENLDPRDMTWGGEDR